MVHRLLVDSCWCDEVRFVLCYGIILPCFAPSSQEPAQAAEWAKGMYGVQACGMRRAGSLNQCSAAWKCAAHFIRYAIHPRSIAPPCLNPRRRRKLCCRSSAKLQRRCRPGFAADGLVRTGTGVLAQTDAAGCPNTGTARSPWYSLCRPGDARCFGPPEFWWPDHGARSAPGVHCIDTTCYRQPCLMRACQVSSGA